MTSKKFKKQLFYMLQHYSINGCFILCRIFPTNDPNITVVSFVGKTNLVSQLPTKVTCINDYFKHPIFQSSEISEEVNMLVASLKKSKSILFFSFFFQSSIEGYFCPKKKVLFLYCNNIYDTNTLLMLEKLEFDNLFEKVNFLSEIFNKILIFIILFVGFSALFFKFERHFNQAFNLLVSCLSYLCCDQC
jgi:hypothetical protein